jgi:hypothetical protein
MRRAIGMMAMSLIISACGSVRPAGSSTGHFDRRYLISAEEIEAAKRPGWNAWDLIAQTRPTFLRSRGATSLRDLTPVQAVVYVDGIYFGKLESLRNLAVEEIRQIEFISSGDATTRYGTDHLGGAILISPR